MFSKRKLYQKILEGRNSQNRPFNSPREEGNGLM